MSGCRTKRLFLLAHPPSLLTVLSPNHSDCTIFSFNKLTVRCGLPPCARGTPTHDLFVSALNHSMTATSSFEYVLSPSIHGMIFFYIYSTHPD